MQDDITEDLMRKLKSALKDNPKAVNILKRYWQDKITIIWKTADVHRAANEKKTVLTEDEAKKVLEKVLDNHDAQTGVNWQALVYTIRENGMGRDITKQELRRFIKRDILAIQK
jgi:hypothetical protein